MSIPIHPIAETALACFAEHMGPSSEADPDQLLRLEAAVRELVDSPELVAAVTTLIHLSTALRRQGAEGPARTIFETAQLAIPALETLTGAHAHALASAARSKFDHFMGVAPRCPEPDNAPASGMSMLALRSKVR